jgi:hypothetical protein
MSETIVGVLLLVVFFGLGFHAGFEYAISKMKKVRNRK